MNFNSKTRRNISKERTVGQTDRESFIVITTTLVTVWAVCVCESNWLTTLYFHHWLPCVCVCVSVCACVSNWLTTLYFHHWLPCVCVSVCGVSLTDWPRCISTTGCPACRDSCTVSPAPSLSTVKRQNTLCACEVEGRDATSVPFANIQLHTISYLQASWKFCERSHVFWHLVSNFHCK